MNKETRTQKIAQIIEKQKPVGRQDIFWHSKPQPMDAYEIPLECLIYNKYNGRILSRTKTLESQGREINPDTEEGKKTIEKLLWESKENKNEITKSDIEEKGQLKVGVITKDGIVIDGNRRVMLLNRLGKSHFRAIVLPVALEDDPIEVEKLETTYQMGEDEKLGYNPIEKYLKAKQIYKKLSEQFPHDKCIDQIANWMGETRAEIEDWLGVVKIIDEYLDYLSYTGVYAMADTPNDGKEDLFLFIKKWMSAFQGKNSDKGFDGYTSTDVDDLRMICFDYVRAKIGKSFDGKSFRIIADGVKKNHFFGNKEIWQSFCDTHFVLSDQVAQQIDAEYPIDHNSENIEASLSNRDSKFRDLVLNIFLDNIAKHTTDLENTKAADKPLELVANAHKAIDAINQKHKSFGTLEVQNQFEKLIEKALNMMQKKSPEHILSIVLTMLDSLKLDKKSVDKEKFLVKIKDVEKAAYQLEKDVKSL